LGVYADAGEVGGSRGFPESLDDTPFAHKAWARLNRLNNPLSGKAIAVGDANSFGRYEQYTSE
jgi:hypothetical protein